jgi:hypothetical protein
LRNVFQTDLVEVSRYRPNSFEELRKKVELMNEEQRQRQVRNSLKQINPNLCVSKIKSCQSPFLPTK